MAVTREGNVIQMTADADAISGKLVVQGIFASGAVAGVVDGEGNPVVAFASQGSIEFPCKIFVEGLARGAGAGHLYIYLA